MGMNSDTNNITAADAAKIYAKEYMEGGLLKGPFGSFMLGFVKGAEWKARTIWHDAVETPDSNKLLLAVDAYEYPYIMPSNAATWLQTVRLQYISKWAYVQDLIYTL